MRKSLRIELQRGCALLTCSLLLLHLAPPAHAFQGGANGNDKGKRTPIDHVIVIIGENRSFDHVFGTYVPPPGQSISNLWSKGIVKLNGAPGPNFANAAQYQAQDLAPALFSISPGGKTPYTNLPPTNTDGAPTSASDSAPAPFATIGAAAAAEPGLLPSDIAELTTGATGLPGGSVDTRVANVNTLANGPYPLTPGVGYDAYAGSPVHRFYQMWQQSDCAIAHASINNPSGCLNDLYPWVETTVGAGANGLPQPTGFTNETTREGSISMGIYNVSQGDAPYLTSLASTYALADNFHQSVMGGTGANHVALGTGDAIWYSDGSGHAARPPANQIENPNPQTGTNNWYTQDGYGGGTYSNCSDPAQPGVGSVENYLASLSISPRCQAGHYYLLNNYAPGYFGDGTVNHGQFVIPPSTLRTIGDALSDSKTSWSYFGEGFNLYLDDPTFTSPYNQYCDICNPFQYSTSVMTDAGARKEHLKDIDDLYSQIQSGTLPAVSFVKPDAFVDGHPASSKLDLFEAFTKKIVEAVQANPDLWASTAIFITFDESGGYWDSGYIQPLDFFGDGPRIPLIVVSPYSQGGQVVHDYSDHVSILKFIEYNWKLGPVTGRSRDNFPNPIVSPSNPYVPLNSPAIGDLTGFFSFGKGH